MTGTERVATCATRELATILDFENWRARVGGRVEDPPLQLRVSGTFRRRDADAWKPAHGHADLIATATANGRLRGP